MTRNVLCWLEQTARERPDAAAFEDDQDRLTYGMLLKRAREIGSGLAGMIRPQTPVLILMEKSPACIAAMLGAVYAGCFYTPVDPAMPQTRLALIAQVLQPACVLCEERYQETAQALAGSAPVVVAQEIPACTDEMRLTAIRRQHIDSDLLYVLFTSGSTGVPKGVAITHRSVVDFIDWAVPTLGIDAQCRFGNQAPLYFDNSVLDIYAAIRAGAAVHFIPKRYFTFPAKMMEYLTAAGINTLFWVPSALTGVAQAGLSADNAPRLRKVLFCGEVMPCRTLNAWRRAVPDALYVNMYGPTEITDVCMYYIVDREFADGDALPIGWPCANTRIHLIDGEICVTGTCLSPGYYRAPEKTAEAFVQNPLRSGIAETIYRTGDLGRYNDRGEMMFIGRKDSQIKRHGYRIELGEIESALCALAEVDDGCCLYDAAQEKIVCFHTGGMEEKQLKRILKTRLPKYMLPDVFIAKAALPKTGNGKTDRVQLRREWEDEHPVL